MSKLDDILKALTWVNEDELGEDRFDGHHSNTVAKAQIRTLMLELVGEDETEPRNPQAELGDEGFDPFLARKSRNELRAELRQKVEGL